MRYALLACTFFGSLLPVRAQNADTRVNEAPLYDFSDNAVAVKYYQKGYRLYHQHKIARAATFYKKAIAEDHQFVEAYDNLGLCYRKLNVLDSAERYYLLSMALYPQGTVAVQDLAVVYEMRGQLDRALECYEKMVALSPEDPEGYYGSSYIYLHQEDYKRALENGLLAEKYYKAQNSGYIQDSQYNIGVAYYYLGDKDSARTYLQLARDGGVVIPGNLVSELGLR